MRIGNNDRATSIAGLYVMIDLDQSVFDGQPPEVTLACMDYDGLLKFGKNIRNYRYTWASERWRGADWVGEREGTDYKPLTSIRRDAPNNGVTGDAGGGVP